MHKNSLQDQKPTDFCAGFLEFTQQCQALLKCSNDQIIDRLVEISLEVFPPKVVEPYQFTEHQRKAVLAYLGGEDSDADL
jgi:hypothetical protein